MEQRCLALDQKIASQNFKISVLNSEIESLDAKHLEDSQKLRDLKSELEELEELGKEKERFYELKGLEMTDFREKVERFVAECRTRVNELRNHVDELRSTFSELHGNSGHFDNCKIAAAEKRKSELVAMKESLNKNLASNYQLRAQYEKQLQNILAAHNEDRRMKKLNHEAKEQEAAQYNFAPSQVRYSHLIAFLSFLDHPVAYQYAPRFSSKYQYMEPKFTQNFFPN
ncbi:uncharacterized protein LOC120010154 isoform X2 [Tripterygium wilfordii]|nr:uncharacterized protein LOC120010154 isoform X2 [Tripterygium wilfordii]